MQSELMSKYRFTDDVPVLRAGLASVLMTIHEPDVCIADVAESIGKEPSLSGRMIGLANSPYYRRSQEITRLIDAISVIGLTETRIHVTRLAIGGHFKATACPLFSEDRFWTSAISLGLVSQQVAQTLSPHRPEVEEAAILAGLLYRIGLLAMAHQYPTETHRVLMRAQNLDLNLVDATNETFGANYADVGSRILDCWELPGLLSEVPEYVIRSQAGEISELPLVVAIARCLISENYTPEQLLEHGMAERDAKRIHELRDSAQREVSRAQALRSMTG